VALENGWYNPRRRAAQPMIQDYWLLVQKFAGAKQDSETKPEA